MAEERGEQLLKVLIEVGERGELVTYRELALRVNEAAKKELFKPEGLALRNLGKELQRLCRRTYEEFGVLPGSVVVKAKDKKPGKGYFKFLASLGLEPNLETWREELNRFYRFCRGESGNTDNLSGFSRNTAARNGQEERGLHPEGKERGRS
jgi:hypothetical protein